MSQFIRNFDGKKGKCDFPLFGKEVTITAEEAPLEYAEKCAEYIAKLPDSVIDRLCEASIRYCESVRQYFEEEAIDIPANISGRDILSYVRLGSVYVPYPQGEGIGFEVFLSCTWEQEHGLEWTIRDSKVLYVGANNVVSPWIGKDDYQNEWNYAIVR